MPLSFKLFEGILKLPAQQVESMVGVMLQNRRNGSKFRLIVMNNACAETIQLDLALRESVKCVDSLVGRDAWREMYNDFSVLRGVIVNATNLNLTLLASLGD